MYSIVQPTDCNFYVPSRLCSHGGSSTGSMMQPTVATKHVLKVRHMQDCQPVSRLFWGLQGLIRSWNEENKERQDNSIHVVSSHYLSIVYQIVMKMVTGLLPVIIRFVLFRLPYLCSNQSYLLIKCMYNY